MILTSDQIRTIEDALELAFDTRMAEFEQNKDKCDREAMQRAVRAARDIKNFQQLLARIQCERGLAS